MKIERRNFLKTLAAAGSWAVTTGCTSLDSYFTADKKDFEREILIVGAGAAGLMAAHTLKKNRIPFRLMEASSHPGGRLYTLESADGSKLEMGAEYFEAHHRLVFELLKEFQLDWEEKIWDPGTSPLWRSSSNLSLTDKDYQKISAHFISQYIQTRVQTFGSSSASVDQYQILSPILAQEMDSYSLIQYLNAHWIQPDERVSAYWDSWSRAQYSAEASRVSALRWLWDQNPDKRTRSYYRPKGGWGQLVQLMYERIAGVIPDHLMRFGWQLSSIRRNRDSFQCVFRTPKGIQVLETKYLILALPINQYKKIEGLADLEISDGKKQAFKQIDLGESSKAFVAFGPNELGSSLTEFEKSPLILRDQVQISAVNNGGSKLWLGGQRSGFQSQWSVPDLENWRAGLVGTNGANSPLEYHVLNWKDRPFVNGARSVWGPKQWDTLASVFETADYRNNLQWAGEHVPLLEKGTVHAALVSGQQAALRLVEKLGVSPV